MTVGRTSRVLILALIWVFFVPSDGQAQPTCAKPGATTPVLLVHGLGGDKSVFDSGSPRLKDSIAMITGTFVDVFDYETVNTKWVTDPAIGQELATRIVCLGNASEAAGGSGKVIVVAHSMGGLAVREALSLSSGGKSASDRTGLVVTLGTPQTGSWLEGFLNGGTTGPVSATVAKIVSSGLRFGCAAAVPAAELLGVCSLLDDPSSDAALAMRPGTSQLNALPMFPIGMPVLAIAGQIHLYGNLFDKQVRYKSDIGDILVRQDSATLFGSNPPRDGGDILVRDCDMNLFELAAGAGWNSCTHGGLLTELNVVTAVDTAVRSWLKSRAPTPVDWKNRRYTTDCGGVKKDEPFQVDISDGGGVALPNERQHFAIGVVSVASGDLLGDGRPDTAVLLSCHPDPSNYSRTEVQVFTQDQQRVAVLRPPDLQPNGTGAPPDFDDHPFSVEGKRLLMGADYYGVGDCHAGGPSLHYDLVWTWDGGKFLAEAGPELPGPGHPC